LARIPVALASPTGFDDRDHLHHGFWPHIILAVVLYSIFRGAATETKQTKTQEMWEVVHFSPPNRMKASFTSSMAIMIQNIACEFTWLFGGARRRRTFPLAKRRVFMSSIDDSLRRNPGIVTEDFLILRAESWRQKSQAPMMRR
jgi:hypothetical protein